LAGRLENGANEVTKVTKVTNTNAIETILAMAAAAGIPARELMAALVKAAAKAKAKTVGKTRRVSNQAQLAKAPPGPGGVKGAPNLFFSKGEGDSGSWIFRYWFHGRRRHLGLGALREVPLARARIKADEARARLKQGVDPLSVRAATRTATAHAARAARASADRWDFARATENYLAAHASSWKHARARSLWVNPLIKFAYPVIGAMPLDGIEVSHVDAVMTACVNGGAPSAAPRIRLRIRQVLDAARALGKCDASRQNPADVGLIKAVRPVRAKAREHYRRIELDSAPAAFQRLVAAAKDSTALSAHVFMIATAARPSEALNAMWSEIDLDKRLWTVPAARMKGAVEHVVPLSDLALASLERQATVRVSGAVFPGRSTAPVSYPTFSAATRSIGFDMGSPHSWRSVFSDIAADVLNIDRETRELALAHGLDAIEGAYRRGTAIESRRVALQRYADHLTGRTAGVVVPLRRA
jgi:integrase